MVHYAGIVVVAAMQKVTYLTLHAGQEFRSIAKRLNLYSIVKLTDESYGEAEWGRRKGGNYSDQVGGLFTHNAKAICE